MMVLTFGGMLLSIAIARAVTLALRGWNQKHTVIASHVLMTWRSPNWNDGAHVWGNASPDSYRPRSDVIFEGVA